MTTIADRLAKLERGMEVPGTSVSRCLAQRQFLERQTDIKVPDGRESMNVWCVAVGESWMPKVFAYGVTIEEAVTDAERRCRAWKRSKTTMLGQPITKPKRRMSKAK